MRRALLGCLFAVSFPAACSAAPPTEENLPEGPVCLDYSAHEPWVAPEGTGHAVRIYFLDASDKGAVRVMINGAVVLDRPLELDTDGTGISGGLVCRLTGSLDLSVTYGDREIHQTLNIVSDEAKLLVHPTWPRIELTYGPLLLD